MSLILFHMRAGIFIMPSSWFHRSFNVSSDVASSVAVEVEALAFDFPQVTKRRRLA